MYRIVRTPDGKFSAIVLRESSGSDVSFGPDDRQWLDFLTWNAKQEVPLDLSDKPPKPPPVDADIERIKAIVAKRDDEITAAEAKEAIVKYLRKRL